MEQELHDIQPINAKHSTQIISMIVGGLLFVIGLAGNLFPAFAGLHMSFLYATVIAVSGVVLFYNGFQNNSRDAFVTCLFFTLFFGLHAIVGWIFGSPGMPEVGFDKPDPKLLVIIPKLHELGRNDHILNTFLSLVLLGGTIDWWRRHTYKGHRTDAIRELSSDYKNRYSQNHKRPVHQ